MFTDMVAYVFPVVKEDVFTTCREAKMSSEDEHWKGAMDEKMKTLYKNSRSELVKLQKGNKVIICKCVFTKKDDPFW